MKSGRVMLTLTVSQENSSSEELRISVPMERITASSLSPVELRPASESSNPSLLSGTLLETSLTWESRVRALKWEAVVDVAGEYMDSPGVNVGLAEAIVHSMKNECVRLFLEEFHEQE